MAVSEALANSGNGVIPKEVGWGRVNAHHRGHFTGQASLLEQQGPGGNAGKILLAFSNVIWLFRSSKA